MKQITLLLICAILLAACSPSAQDLVNDWQEALNKGDIDAALSYLSEDAVVTIIPPAEGDGVYKGHAEIRGWYDSITSAKGSGSLINCKTANETITCLSTYADEGLKSIGVDFIEGDWLASVRGGKITSYTFTMTPESLAKLPAPNSEPVEALATSIDDLLGTWWFPSEGLMIEFNVGGASRVISGSKNIGQIDSGTYKFDAGNITFNKSTACNDQPATYEAYVTTENGERVSLRMQVVGSDSCDDRVKTLATVGKIYNP
jgi:hypothetical protein